MRDCVVLPLAHGKAEGLASEKNWQLKFWAKCEICSEELNSEFVSELVLDCQEKLQSDNSKNANKAK